MRSASLRLLPVLALLALPSAAAADAISIGPSGGFSEPGVAVDPAGTAYIAWRGPETGVGSLQFCRLPRGARACDSRHAIATPGESLDRPFVLVSGSRVTVVQFRAGGAPNGLLSHTSNDRGATFGAAQRMGSVEVLDAVPGPGASLSGISAASRFQNAPLGGGGAEAYAELSTDHYNGTVGLDGAAPVAVFASNSLQGQFRRYDGTGDLNSAANWAAPVELGFAQYPHLAGGPRGLFLLDTRQDKTVTARKWNGSAFGPAATVAPAVEAPTVYGFQDAGGRLHAVYASASSDGNALRLRHAVSDDGVAWRSGTVVSGTSTYGLPRVAAAPDHVGVAVWNYNGTHQIQVAAIGPDAPVDPVGATPPPASPLPPPRAPAAKPKPRISAKGSARRAGRKVRIKIAGRLLLPSGVSKAAGCSGKVKLTVKRGRKVVGTKTLTVRSSCAFALRGTIKRSKVKRAKRLVVTLLFRGNAALSPARKAGSLKLKG